MTTLVETIINAAMNADIKLGKGNLSHDTEQAMKTLSKITGVPVGYNVRTIIHTGGGIAEAVDDYRFKFNHCQEVTFSQMYPYILRNEYGDHLVGGYYIKDLVDGLIEARKATKTDTWYGDTSIKIKVLLNLLYTFIIRSDLVYADDASKGVCTHGRRLIAELFDKLYELDDVYPVRVHIDEIFITSLNGKVEIPPIDMGDYPINIDEIDSHISGSKDLVIVDRIRYIVGRAKRFNTIHMHEEKNGLLTRRVSELQKRVWRKV